MGRVPACIVLQAPMLPHFLAGISRHLERLERRRIGGWMMQKLSTGFGRLQPISSGITGLYSMILLATLTHELLIEFEHQ